MSEGEIEAGICTYLKSQGIPFSVTNASSNMGGWKRCRGRKTTAGWPDLVGCMPPGNGNWYRGTFIAIEVKAAKGKLSEDQEKTLEALRQAGALVIVAHSVAEVSEALWGR